MATVAFEHMQKPLDIEKAEIEINERFEKTPLESMQPTSIPTPEHAILKAAECIETLAEILYN